MNKTKREFNKILSHCELCPRRCGVDRLSGKTGVCSGGALARVSAATLHHWEEPCISGENGSGTVFFSGCPLGCVFCQNVEISRGRVGTEVSADRLSRIFLDLERRGAHNINLVTPTHFVPQILEARQAAVSAGLKIPFVFNCGGYELPETIDMLEGSVDVYLPDFKYISPQYAKDYSAAEDYPSRAAAALEQMVRQTGAPVFDGDGMMKSGVLVRHLLLPGLVGESKKALEYLYRAYQNDIFISIMNQYTPMRGMTGELARAVTDAEYDELVDFAISLGIENAFVQQGGTVSESFIPSFGGELAE